MTTQSPRKVTPGELLHVREEQWSARLRGCSLVAELKVEERHSRQVAQVLGRTYVQQTGTPRAERMFHTWPACVAVAVTGIAARDYRQGELWPELWDGLGYHGEHKDQAAWGHGFLAALGELGMAAFPELPMPYLGPILMHTGIPNYCLEDYFRLVAQRRATDRELDAEGFLAWATGRPHRLNVLDRPARRFLDYGTEYALDFVDRTFDLLDRLRAPDANLDGVGLPARVMTRARELAAKGRLDLRAPRTGSTGRTRTERPRIGLDAFGRGIEVVLPAVGDAPDGSARWSVTADGVTTMVRSRAQWTGVAEAAPSTTLPLLQPARTVVVALDGWDHQAELPVVDPNAPMLVFTEDGRRPAATMPLPPDVVWVAYPAEHELTAEGPIRVTIEGRLPLGWDGWRLRQVDLTEARSLGLEGFSAGRRAVRGHTRPRIATGTPVPGVTTPYGTPVHARAPEVWLPGAANARTEWTVEIRPSGEDRAVVSEKFMVDESRTLDGLWERLPRPLLGSFDIVARGPLGRGASRTVFVAEGLGIRFTPKVRVFAPMGLVDARAELVTPVGVRADPRTVSFGPDESASVIEYRTDQETEPLVITPPHLQVMHERTDRPPVWRAGPLRIPTDEFSEEPGALLVRLPDADGVPPLEAVVGGRTVQEVPPSGRSRRGTGRYDLTRLGDTVAEHRHVELTLRVGDAVRLASVRPRALATRAAHEDDHLRLEEFVPVEGLVAGVYASTAPWRGPLVTPVTEDGTIPLPPELRRAGPLLVTLLVDDPWVPAEWPRWPTRYLMVGGDGHLVGDDPEETALSRFVAGKGEFPEHIDDLRRAWTLVRLAKRLRTIPEVPGFLVSCARPILRRPFDAITALAGLEPEPGRTVASVVSSGLAATAVPDAAHADTACGLWPVAPVLGALAGELSDSECLDAAQRQCGDTLEEIGRNGTDPHASVGRFGPEAERMLHMDSRQIDGIWRAAQVVPQALLDADTRAVAARRLFDRRGDVDVKVVGKTASTVTGSTLTILRDRPRLVDQIEARRHPQGRGGLFAIPAASAAFAILARLAARGDVACGRIEQLFRTDWTRLARCAPDLVAIDVILAELLVGRGDTEAP